MQIPDLEGMRIPLGKLVQIEVRTRDADSKRGDMTGIVVAVNKRYFTVRGDKYCQAYLKIDLATGEIGMKPVGREVA